MAGALRGGEVEIGSNITDLMGVFLTHAHGDHFAAAGTLHCNHGIPVYVNPDTHVAIRTVASNRSYGRIRHVLPIPQSLGRIGIETFPTRHEVPGGKTCGFVITIAGSRIGVMTDTGTVTPEALQALTGCRVLVVEANYSDGIMSDKLQDPSFRSDWYYLRWIDSDTGHLSNRQCAEFLERAITSDTEHVFLAHLSNNHHDPRADNNSYDRALQSITRHLKRKNVRIPAFHQTYRRDATEGRISAIIRF